MALFVFTSPVPVVSGLPPSGSWQDLKDHMREAGDVCFADVQPDGEGVVEFLRREDMEYALRRLDGTEFRSHQVTHSIIESLTVRFIRFYIIMQNWGLNHFYDLQQLSEPITILISIISYRTN